MSEPRKVAAVYARVSRADDSSIESQIRHCREIAAADGYDIPEGPAYCYTDNHITGATRNRNGLTALIDAVMRQGSQPRTSERFERVYIREKARLWRGLDPRYPDWLAVEFERSGTTIRYCDEDQSIDFSVGVTGAAIGHYLSNVARTLFAAHERTELIEKFRIKKRHLVVDGFYPGGLAPFGIEKVAVDPVTHDVIRVVPNGEQLSVRGTRYALRTATHDPADMCSPPNVVRYIYQSILDGMSVRAIGKAIAARGIPSPSGKPYWTDALVFDIAVNPLYKGDLIWARQGVTASRSFRGRWQRNLVTPTEITLSGREPIYVKGFISDPLISPEVWDAVQAELQGRRTLWDRRRTSSPRHLLTGKVMCSGCGALYCGRSPNLHHKTRHTYTHPAGYQNRYRECPSVHRSIRAAQLEQAVFEQVLRVCRNEHLEELVRDELASVLEVDRLREHEQAIRNLEKRIADLDEEVARTHQAWRTAQSQAFRQVLQRSGDQWGRSVDAARGDLQKLKATAEYLEGFRKRQIALAAAAPEIVQRIESGSPDEQRAVIEAVLHSVSYDAQTRTAEIRVRVYDSTTTG